MKRRSGWVSNSSTASFVAVGVKLSDSDCKLYGEDPVELWELLREVYPVETGEVISRKCETDASDEDDAEELVNELYYHHDISALMGDYAGSKFIGRLVSVAGESEPLPECTKDLPALCDKVQKEFAPVWGKLVNPKIVLRAGEVST